MKVGRWRTWFFAALASLSAVLPAQANVIDFEDVLPTLFQGTAIASRGFDFTSDGSGFSGVDIAGAFVFGNAPANADGQFLFMLNGDGMLMRPSNGQLMVLSSFEASFIAPLGGLGSGILPGELHVFGLKVDGGLVVDDFSFTASDTNGDFAFSSFGAGALSGMLLQQVFFAACVYDGNGCSFSPLQLTPPQFALDNINAQIPEPASVMLVILALGAAGASARRRIR